MRRAATAFALLAFLAQHAGAMAADEMTLTLPHPLRAGEMAWIQVQVGTIARGQEIDVTTAAGEELGVISPFGVRAGHAAGTYTLPVPAGTIRDGRVAIRLRITQFGAPPRPPTPQEVRGIRLTTTGAPH
ncbi:MAG TPA: hypothetical protein PLD10_17560 [Rhodopila sp.]|nr:hypothetical protein [Rhodopila sp.]